MSIIGIDLGTTNSLATYWKDGQVQFIPDASGGYLMPSAVGCIPSEDGENFFIGHEAKALLSSKEGETALSFKRFMGTKKTWRLGNSDYTAMELSAMVLKKIKDYGETFLGEPIDEAVITVPAYFNDKQRSDTKKAAQIAGLKADRLVNEPSAAALAYRMEQVTNRMTGKGMNQTADQEMNQTVGKGMNQMAVQGMESGDFSLPDQSLLVFDFGGGTLDLSYVECFDNVIEIIAVAGDNALGGDDIDALMAEHFCRIHHLEPEALGAPLWSMLLCRAEEAKRKLEEKAWAKVSLEYAGTDYTAEFSEDLLFELCMPLFSKIKTLFLHILEDAGHSIAELDDLIMVGGSSRLSVVKRFLTELLGKEPVVLGDTDKVVAMGAGIYTGIRGRNQDIRDILMTDVCPFTLGVESFRRQGDKQGYLLPMIERNSTLPAFRCERLVTLYDYQSKVTIKIYQGEEYYAKDNIYLGEVTANVEPKKAGLEWIDVYFSYDINGILHVEVVNSRQEKNQILLANQQLSPAELEHYKRVLEEQMISEKEQENHEKLLEKARGYYEQSTGARREWIGRMIDWFIAGINSNRRYRIKKAVREMEEQLKHLAEEDEHLEEWLFNGELKNTWEWDEEEEAAEGGQTTAGGDTAEGKEHA